MPATKHRQHKKQEPTLKKATQAVRAGNRRDKNMGGLNTPLMSSSAIEYLDDSEVRYPRYFNTLNHDVVADKMNALESAEAGLVTSSGMAAISAIVFGLLDAGDHIVLTEGLYGGTHAMQCQRAVCVLRAEHDRKKSGGAATLRGWGFPLGGGVSRYK